MLLPILGIFFFTCCATRWLLRPGNPLSAVDAPNHRSLHKTDTPKGGGLAIVAGLLLLEGWQRIRGEVLFPNAIALVGFVLIADVSFHDDRRPVPSAIRLLIHLAAAFALLHSGLQLDALPLPVISDQPLALGWLAIPVTLLATVWFTNLYNFMDGMDGFAGGMTVLGFGGCALLAWLNGDPQLTLLSGAIAAAGCGFLVWNFPPAKIFMGDVAAAPLGYLVAVVTFLGIQNQSLDLWQPLLIFSPFWVDATCTLLRRLLQGERVWTAHRSHAYQRFAQAGWGHRRTTLVEYAFMILMIAAAWLFGEVGPLGQAGLLTAVLGIFMLAWVFLRAVEKAYRARGTE